MNRTGTAAQAVEIEIGGVATGGEGVGHLPDGRAVFVRGALPGERVAVTVTEERKRFARAEMLEVIEASPARVAPPCAHDAAGCGGCGWQHVEPGTQRELKATIVLDALRRIGKVDPPPLDPGPVLPTTAGRTTVRAAVDDTGRAGFRAQRSHDVVPVADGGCLVAHPLVDEVLQSGRFPSPVAQVTVRAGAATGERLVLVDPSGAADCEVPEGTILVGADELAAGRRAWIHEMVAGRRWRISAQSFFQTRPDGAEALVAAVASAAAGGLVPGAKLVDLYGGVGLLAGALGERADGRVVLVEANRSAVADARVNLADIPRARVIGADVRRWRPSAADVVVADPSRHGLGDDAVGRVDATRATTLVLVSCDAAALGRDAGLLAADGWTLESVRLVDVFPYTPHVEVVTGWARARP